MQMSEEVAFFACWIASYSVLIVSWVLSEGSSGYSSRSRSGTGREKYGPPVRTEYRLIVENLSSRCSWQDLKVSVGSCVPKMKILKLDYWLICLYKMRLALGKPESLIEGLVLLDSRTSCVKLER